MFTDDLLRANKIGTPIVFVQTQDAIATAKKIREAVGDGAPLLEWDCVRGIRYANTKSQSAAVASTNDPLELLASCIRDLPKDAFLVMHGLNRFLDLPHTNQAVLNLRDEFKEDCRTLVGLGVDFSPWPELTHSVMVLDDPLPDSPRLAGVVSETCNAAEIVLGIEKVCTAAEKLQGLTEFAAEQSVAMSLTMQNGKGALDQDRLWQRKQKQIEQTPGLKVWHGHEKFDGIGGCENIKRFLTRFGTGPNRPNAIVFVDEIEKAIAGEGDTSGVSQDQLGVLLTEMQDQNYDGCIFIGPPGAAKSAVAKAAGNEFGVPTVQLDLGGLKGSLVGQSEQQARAALKVIRAISSGKALWIATCNGISSLKPELRRRFTMGVYYFDLPTLAEREKIWSIYKQQFNLAGANDDSPLPDDEGWTGAEIRTCCRLAHLLGISLIEASKYIVPVAKQAPEMIEKLRDQAAGRFLSANSEGVYSRQAAEQPVKKGRKIAIAS